MSLASDPLGSTTNILTLFSFTLSTVGAAAAYTSFCATPARYNSITAVLDSWEQYITNLTPQQRNYFEQIRPGELSRMTDEIQECRSGASAMDVELRNQKWTRYFPWTDVCGEFRDFNKTIQGKNKDFYSSTEAVRRMQKPKARNEAVQALPTAVPGAGRQAVPPIDRNRALRWLTVMRNRAPDLRGIVDGLGDIIVSQFFDRGV